MKKIVLSKENAKKESVNTKNNFLNDEINIVKTMPENAKQIVSTSKEKVKTITIELDDKDSNFELKEDSEFFRTTKGKFISRIAKSLEEKELIRLSKDNHEVSLRFLGKKSIIRKINKTKGKILFNKKEKSSISFENFENGLDLNYEIHSRGIKESIIVREKQDDYTFNFTMNIGGLNPRYNEETRCIELCENDKVIYRLLSPFMKDAGESLSNDCSYEIELDGEVLNLTLKANAEWINSSERVFPVVIDPTIEINNVNDIISIDQTGAPLSAYGGIFPENTFVVGIEDKTSGPTWIVRVTLDKKSLLSSIRDIQKIYLNFTVHSFSNFHYAEDCLNLMYNNKIYQSIKLNEIDNKSSFNIDITELILESTESKIVFYVNATNKFPTGKHSYICFYKFKSEGNDPKLILTYYDKEDDLYVPENEYAVGRAGTTFVNIKTGSFRHAHSDASIMHNCLNFDINHIFDSKVFDDEENEILSSFMGAGWRTNLHQYLIKSPSFNTFLGSQDVTYVDGDGKEHIFHQKWYYIDDDGIKHYVSNKSVYIDVDQKLKHRDNNKKIWDIKFDFSSKDGLTLVTSESFGNYKPKESLNIISSIGLQLKNKVIKLEEVDSDKHIFKLPVFNTINGTIDYKNITQLDDNKFVSMDGNVIEPEYQKLPLLIDENGLYFKVICRNENGKEEKKDHPISIFIEFTGYPDQNNYISTDEIENIKIQIKQIEENLSSIYSSCITLINGIETSERQLNFQKDYYKNDIYQLYKDAKKEFYMDDASIEGMAPYVLKHSITCLSSNNLSYEKKTNKLIEKNGHKALIEDVETEKNCTNYVQAYSNYLQILTNKLDIVTKELKEEYAGSEEEFDLFAYVEQLKNYKFQLNRNINKINEQLKNIRVLELKMENLIDEQMRKVNDFIYDENGNILGFDGYGRLVLVQDNYDNRLNIEYGFDNENKGKLLSISSENQSVVFNYDKKTGFLKSLIDSSGRKTKYEYDNNRLILIKYNDGKKTIIDYNDSFNITSPLLESNEIIKKLDGSIFVRTYCLNDNNAINGDTILLGDEEKKNIVFHHYIFNDDSNSTIIIDKNSDKYVNYYFDYTNNVVKQEDKETTKVTFYKDNFIKHKVEYKTYDTNRLEVDNPVLETLAIYPSSSHTYQIDLNKFDLPVSNMLGLKVDLLSNSFENDSILNFKLKVTVQTTNKDGKISRDVFEQDYQEVNLQTAVLPICINRDLPTKLTVEITSDSSDYNDPSISSIDLIKLVNGIIYDYDGDKHLIKEQNGYKSTIYEDYNDSGMPLKVIETNVYGDEVITKYSCNNQGKLTNVEDSKGNVEEYFYNDKGQCIEKRTYNKKDASLMKVERSEYDEQGRVLFSKGAIKDQNGNYPSKEIFYLPNTSIKSRIRGVNGETTCYTYDFNSGDLISLSSSVDGISNSTTFSYNYGLLTSLSHHGVRVDYSYDGRGRKIKTKLNGNIYSHNYFSDNYTNTNLGITHGEFTESVFVDGFKTTSLIDSKGKLRQTSFSSNHNDCDCIYEYEDDKLIKVTSSKNNRISQEADLEIIDKLYNDYGNVSNYTKTVNNERHFKQSFIYDERNRISEVEFSIENGDALHMLYLYDDENRVSSLKFNNSLTAKFDYDVLNRVRHQSVSVEKNIGNYVQKVELCHEYSYMQQDEKTLDLITEDIVKIKVDGSKLIYLTDNATYNYDVNGNIISIQRDDKKTRYFYDSLNRLIREDNPLLKQTIIYKYDKAGNILQKKVYTYNITLEEIQASAKTINDYTYSCDGWRDQLVDFNGKYFEYDEMGRPLYYKNNVLSWETNGNLLGFNTNNGLVVKYSYDSNGIRKNKVVNDTKTSFIVDETKIIRQITGNIVLTFRYALNKLIGFQYNDGSVSKEYIYLRNIQGDIISIYDEDGNEVGGYAYDAYGNHEIIKDIDGIATINPFRYRGYYFDNETGFFYCNSRYYDPEIARWISPDALSILDETFGQINGLNLYMYCGNNPVMRIDPSGMEWWHWLLGALIVVGLGVALVASAGSILASVVAVASAANGIAFGTMTTTLLSYAFFGSSIAFLGAFTYNIANVLSAPIRGSTYEEAWSTMENMGESVLITEISFGATFATGGYISYMDQLYKPNHSWSTESRKYWINAANDPNNKDFYLNDRALKGLTPNGYVLHHPFGRVGHNWTIYEPITIEEHKLIHNAYGYGRGGGYYKYREWVDVWKLILKIFRSI